MITFTLPLPANVLHPNGRTRSWQKRARLVKKARGEACFVASAVAPKVPWESALLHVTFHLKRRRDEDGLISWLKAYIDGIQDAGFVANDSRIRIATPIEQVTGKKESPRVVLSLLEVTS